MVLLLLETELLLVSCNSVEFSWCKGIFECGCILLGGPANEDETRTMLPPPLTTFLESVETRRLSTESARWSIRGLRLRKSDILPELPLPA